MHQHKRGQSLELSGLIPTDYQDNYFTGWDITSEVRNNNGELVGTLDCTFNFRTLTIRAIDTDDWELGRLSLDVKMVRPSDSFTLITPTIYIELIDRVTL